MQDTCDSHNLQHCACLSTDYPVSFAIFALARSHRARAGAMLSEIGLFPGQEILLTKIAEKEGESQKSLCDSFGLDHSTVAKSLGRLEAQGLIHRHKCSIDARVTKVWLTDKGRETTSAISKVWAELEKLTLTDLSADERAQLVAIADKIIPHMEA
jgi:MarR family transcriptional regulator, organic hydroperoxide resistance regulator